MTSISGLYLTSLVTTRDSKKQLYSQVCKPFICWATEDGSHLFGLLFDGQGPDQSRDFFGGLPLGQLAETLLTGPDRRVDDLQEELTGARVEDEDGAVDPKVEIAS